MYAFTTFRRCLFASAIVAATAVSARADVFRWDNGQLIPGTEGITPGPGVQLDHHELVYANFYNQDLAGSRFDFSNLSYASFYRSTLMGANLSGANLAYADQSEATLTNANLSGAVVTGAYFIDTTSRGFTKEQLYSTASYQAKNLTGIWLTSNDLNGWDFHGQNLTNAHLHGSTFSNANMGEAVVTGANFNDTTSRGFTKEQLYSTASYQAKNLSGIWLGGDSDLSGWDFNGQNLNTAWLTYSTLTNANLSGANLTNAYLHDSTLTNANLSGANLTDAELNGIASDITNADLSGAVVIGTNFTYLTHDGFTKEQLYSTASYQAKNLQRIRLGANDLSGWDLHGQNLASANLDSATLTNANLSGAVVTGADFTITTPTGFTREQLYSTASYQAKDLQGISLRYNNLSGWDFHGQNLANANLEHSALTNANLSGADTRGVQGMDLAGTTSHNAILPDGTIAGLNLVAGDQLAVRNYHGDAMRYPTPLPPIPITVHDQMTMADGGVLQLHVGADGWDSTISFQPGIPVSLGGSLELAFAGGVDAAAQAGRTIDVFNWDGVSPTGAFTIDSKYSWDLSQLYTSGDVTLLSALVGDTNGDGQVGLDDLNNVRNHFGDIGATGLPGDAIPFDGIVDLSDVNAVRNNFGASAQQAVPEPATVLLLAFGYLAMSASHRSRRASLQSPVAHNLA